MNARVRRLRDYALSQLSQTSTIRSIFRLLGMVLGGVTLFGYDAPRLAVLLGGASVTVAELVGVLFPDEVKRGNKLRGQKDAEDS